MKHLFYLMGKSASGKDTVYEYLLGSDSLHLEPLGPWTTRPIRAKEQEGVEYHFTDRIGIGTLESFLKMRDYYPEGYVVPIYIEVEDGTRLARALKRERKPGNHRYEEMCRRFLADQKDFSEENLLAAGIQKRFINENAREECFSEVESYIRGIQDEL